MTPPPGNGPDPELDLEVYLAYMEHGKAVYRYALRLTRGDHQAAQDTTQEVFMDAYRHWDRFQQMQPAQQRSWLYTCASRRVIDGWRAAQVQLRGEPAEHLPEQPDPRGEEEILGGISAEIFWKEMTTAVDERAYRAAYLKWHETWTVADIARHLGVDRATVYRDLEQAVAVARRSKTLSPEDEGREA